LERWLRKIAAPQGRLDGAYSIATVVDEFIDRIMVDPRFNANPRVDEAHHHGALQGFKYLVHGNGSLGYAGR
jgi:hypothetical protein